MNKSLKILGFVFVLAGAILLFRFVLGGNEDTWICQNGEWVKHGNPSEPQPIIPCEKNGQSIEEVAEQNGFKKVSFEESRQIAENYAKNSSTYKFDGKGLELDSSVALDCPYCWEFIFSFNSQHGGYGDRTGQVLTQVITPHKIKVTVKEGEVVLAVIDQTFDEISRKFIK